MIQPIVIEAARRRGDDLPTLLALIAHKPQQEQAAQAWQRALVAIAGRLEAKMVFEADQALNRIEESPALREQFLSAAIDRLIQDETDVAASNPESTDPRDPLESSSPDELDSLIDLLLLRAQVRLGNGDPTQALADYQQIDSLNQPLTSTQMQQYNLGRLRAHLLAGRTTEAVQIVKVWVSSDQRPAQDRPSIKQIVDLFLSAAQRAIQAKNNDYAHLLLSSLEEHLDAYLTPPLREEIAAIRGQLVPAPPQAAGDPDRASPADAASQTPTGDGEATESSSKDQAPSPAS